MVSVNQRDGLYAVGCSWGGHAIPYWLGGGSMLQTQSMDGEPEYKRERDGIKRKTLMPLSLSSFQCPCDVRAGGGVPTLHMAV